MIFIGFIEVETDRALLFQDHFWHEPDWMPKSQVEIMREYDTHEVKLIATAWICEKKELKEFNEVKNAASRT